MAVVVWVADFVNGCGWLVLTVGGDFALVKMYLGFNY